MVSPRTVRWRLCPPCASARFNRTAESCNIPARRFPCRRPPEGRERGNRCGVHQCVKAPRGRALAHPIARPRSSRPPSSPTRRMRTCHPRTASSPHHRQRPRGALRAGQRLVESDLTRTLRVSRGPVREAFRRLDALGILSRAMHRGACVRTLSRAEAVDLMIAVEGIDILTSRLAATAVKNRTAVVAWSRWSVPCGRIGTVSTTLQPCRGSGSSSTTS